MEMEDEEYEHQGEGDSAPTQPAPATTSPTHSANLSGSGTNQNPSQQKEVKILETAEDISERRDAVLGRYSAFKSEVKLKREKLEDSRRYGWREEG